MAEEMVQIVSGRRRRMERIICRACGVEASVRAGGKGFCSRACGSRIAKRGNSYASKGDSAGYSAAHRRVYRLRGKALGCERCGSHEQDRRYEWANLTGNLTDPMDYESMCVPCHREYDVRCRPRGSAHSNARLTESAIPAIRERAAAGETFSSLAREFGVSDATIARAVRRITWKHLP
jgi:lambda repressor-like predicted transcriptional regulator